MTRDELDTMLFVRDRVSDYHKATGKYPTCEEAISIIRKGRVKYFSPVKPYFDKHYIMVRSYQRSATLELIRLIQDDPWEDPIKTIYEFYSFLDDVMGESNGGFISGFAYNMKEAVGDVLDLFR